MFRWTKLLPNPATSTVQKYFGGICFCPCSKDHHRLHVIIHTEQKNSPIYGIVYRETSGGEWLVATQFHLPTR